MYPKVPKNPWASKTLWFNLLTLIVGIVTYFGFAEFEADPNVAPLAAGIAAFVRILLPLLAPLVNIVLRFITKQPIRLGRR